MPKTKTAPMPGECHVFYDERKGGIILDIRAAGERKDADGNTLPPYTCRLVMPTADALGVAAQILFICSNLTDDLRHKKKLYPQAHNGVLDFTGIESVGTHASGGETG